jgi:hypothetical protein
MTKDGDDRNPLDLFAMIAVNIILILHDIYFILLPAVSHKANSTCFPSTSTSAT